MKKLLLLLLLFPTVCFGWTAHVEFDAPTDITYLTDVLVTEVSGDYSSSYGQRSGPGDSSVEIGNIKPSTTYYFVAYRLIPGTWERSDWSDELEYTTSAYLEPIVNVLPSIPLGDIKLNIVVTVDR